MGKILTGKGNKRITVRGFTLLELLVVLGIIGIIAVIIPPVTANYYSGVEIVTTVERLVLELRQMRIKAISDNKTYRFRIYREDDLYRTDDDSNNDYIIYYLNDKGDVRVVRRGELPGKYTLYKNLEPAVVKKEYYDRISFTGCGTACPGTIGLGKNSVPEEIYKIVISQMGRIRIEKE